MARKKYRRSLIEPTPESVSRVEPEAVDKLDALMAEEVRKMPPPARTVGPVNIGMMIRDNLELPAGASVKFKESLASFRIPPDEEKDHIVEAVVSAGDKATAKAALDAAIKAAEPEKTWAFEEARFFLHAVQYSQLASNQISLKYIFRLRPPEPEREEVKNG